MRRHVMMSWLVAALALSAGCASTVPTDKAATNDPEPAVTAGAGASSDSGAVKTEILAPEPVASASHGIKFQSLRLSGAGLLLDFRFQVVDVNEAKHIINRKTDPFVIDLATGHQFHVPHAPKVGTLRHMGGKLQDGRSYSMLFANPGRTIKAGSSVSLVVGHYRLENVTVQ